MAGKSKRGGERHLWRQGNVFWYRQQIPKAVHAIIGGPQFVRVNLRTADVIEAKRRRDELESQTRIQFRHIRTGRRTILELPGWKPAEATARAPRGPAEWGSLWREALADAHASDDAKAVALVTDLATDEAERFGDDDAKRHAFTDAFK